MDKKQVGIVCIEHGTWIGYAKCPRCSHDRFNTPALEGVRYTVYPVDLDQFGVMDHAQKKLYIRDGGPRAYASPAILDGSKRGKAWIHWPLYTREECEQVAEWLNERHLTHGAAT